METKDGVVIHDPMGREQKPVIINESGLYSLILLHQDKTNRFHNI